MGTVNDQFEDLAERIKALEQQRLQMVEARKSAIGGVAERLQVLRYSDEAIAGALSVLVGATAGEVKELESKGATFRRRPGRKPAAKTDGAGKTRSADKPGASAAN